MKTPSHVPAIHHPPQGNAMANPQGHVDKQPLDGDL
jgi:hypothetical protein